jgi:hypothetical protein
MLTSVDLEEILAARHGSITRLDKHVSGTLRAELPLESVFKSNLIFTAKYQSSHHGKSMPLLNFYLFHGLSFSFNFSLETHSNLFSTWDLWQLHLLPPSKHLRLSLYIKASQRQRQARMGTCISSACLTHHSVTHSGLHFYCYFSAKHLHAGAEAEADQGERWQVSL